MALESGTYINSLNASNPAATDGIAQADDHMRLIKSTVKASFPGVTGAVTSTHTELNALDGFTGVVADLNYAKDLRATGVTAAELDKLDGFTGTADDLNYAKDLRATGVTSTEYDYLDGVTSNIQTQLAAKQAINANNTARGYTSTTALWPASGTTATLAHGLGAFPSFVKVFCENVNASSSFGWTAGERFQISSHLDGSGANARGCSISFNATNVYISIPPAGLFFLSNTSGSISPLAGGTWTSVSSGPAGSAPNFRLIVNAYT